MIEIPLSEKSARLKGKYIALIDDEDEDLAALTWSAETKKDSDIVYALRKPRISPIRIAIRMHRVIAERVFGYIPNGIIVDHIKHGHISGVDNRRDNLRLASYANNLTNSRVRSDNSSGFKGVTWHKGDRKWQAQLTLNRRLKYLGSFSNANDAARAYDDAARAAFGEFACLNFPEIAA